MKRGCVWSLLQRRRARKDKAAWGTYVEKGVGDSPLACSFGTIGDKEAMTFCGDSDIGLEELGKAMTFCGDSDIGLEELGKVTYGWAGCLGGGGIRSDLEFRWYLGNPVRGVAVTQDWVEGKRRATVRR